MELTPTGTMHVWRLRLLGLRQQTPENGEQKDGCYRLTVTRQSEGANYITPCIVYGARREMTNGQRPRRLGPRSLEACST